MSTVDLFALLHQQNALEFDVDAFIAKLRQDEVTQEADLFIRLVRSACFAGSQANAIVAGHQTAIRRLFPETPAAAITAFCVSESRGPHPKYIETKLDIQGGTATITGEKMWGTMAPPADMLYVAASIGVEEGQNQLRMVGVETGQESIEQIPLPPERQAGAVPICDLKFTDTRVTSMRDDDAYNGYIKPFRLIEDVFSTIGMQIVLYRLGAKIGITHEQREDLLGLIVQGQAIAETDMDSPPSLLLISSYLRRSQAFWDNMNANPTSELTAHWQFDRPILSVAARARMQRRSNAWAQLGEPLSEED